MLRIDINLVYIIINILILYFLLKKFLIKPLDNILAQRQAKVDGMLNHASATATEAMQLKEKYENQIAAVQSESDRIVEQAKKDAQFERDKILDQANGQAKDILTKARETVTLERERLTMRDLHVLLFLANNPDRDTARDVAELRGLPKSQVSGAVDLLAERKLLERLPDRRDRRVVHLVLTAAGQALGGEARQIQSACIRTIFSPLTETEAEQFQALLEKLLTGAEHKLRKGAQS